MSQNKQYSRNKILRKTVHTQYRIQCLFKRLFQDLTLGQEYFSFTFFIAPICMPHENKNAVKVSLFFSFMGPKIPYFCSSLLAGWATTNLLLARVPCSKTVWLFRGTHCLLQAGGGEAKHAAKTSPPPIPLHLFQLSKLPVDGCLLANMPLTVDARPAAHSSSYWVLSHQQLASRFQIQL